VFKLRVVNSILDLIGNTPLLRLNKVTRGIKANVLMKLEYLNPSGSYKDRIARRMIEDAEKIGRLRPGYTIMESSSGNTAIALSMVGAVKGYRVKIFYPGEVWQKEKRKILSRFGAEIVRVERVVQKGNAEGVGLHGAIIEQPGRRKCLEMEQRNPDAWWVRQFSNPSNPMAHRELGQEILDQTDCRVDVYVSSVGTGGNFLGVAKVLKEAVPHVKCVAVEPRGWAGHEAILSGWKKGEKKETVVSGGILLDILKEGIVDEIVTVGNEEARNMAYRLSREEGLFVGISTGANALISINEARKLGKNKNVVTVAVDRGDRYFSDERYIT
jgi:cysteine synthase A